ncbi:MAG: FAD-dependent thymidylate synthase [Okeania sp. SIO2F4]|uniref:FAD-dependent thymidylate synthase n=1 Tax=Okeania sp. SIO2F4 TaxID=2607790 RepID=UPI00142C14B9|nr:FAD-dependent thymidylate synthase [Okeania sp. SIO2F4]NES04528.1 FAD-dependent thymidylate synthase [Okeania sp. SIO2F4]
MDKFRVEVIAKTPNPQQVIYAALHQDYSEGFVFDEGDNWPSEAKCGEIIVKRLLAGDRGHYGCIEHPQITFNCGFFPHSVMQQARTHRIGCCLSGNTKVRFVNSSLFKGEEYYEETIEKLAHLWHYGRKNMQTSKDAKYMQESICKRTILTLDTKTNQIVSSKITNIYINGEKETYTIKTVSGKEIRATLEHQFWTNQGWKRLKEFNNSTQLSEVEFTGNKISPQEINFLEKEIFDEKWIPVINYEGYEVSSLGCLGSYFPKGGRGNYSQLLSNPQIKKLNKSKNYLFTSLSHGIDSGKVSQVNRHRLVMENFKQLGEDEQFEVRHLNGNNFHNRLENIVWGSSRENKIDNINNNIFSCNGGVFVGIESIEKFGKEITYDIEVEHPEHNFIANGLVVHNSFDVQSYRFCSGKVIAVAEGKTDIETAFYLRPVGEYSDRQGKKYYYSAEQREEDLQWCLEAAKKYKIDLELGMSEEHARGKIPFDYRQHFVVSFNCRSLLHFLDLRFKKNAQLEIQKLCELMWPHVQDWVPNIADWYEKNRLGKGKLAP